MNLEFFYATEENYYKYHRWPFVYLHGEAERIEGFDYTDLCVCNIPMDECVDDALLWKSRTVIEFPCKVHGLDAIAVIGRRSEYDRYFSGRIALLHDEEALKHARDIAAWRQL